MAAGRHLEFDPTGNGAVRSAVPENPILVSNMKGIGWRIAAYGYLKFLQNVWMGPEVGRRSVVVGRRSVGRSVVNIHTSYTDLITPLSLR